MANENLTIGTKGLDLIKGFEKLRLDVYNDGYGYLTVGWGHLVGKNEKLKLGDKITAARADELLKSDLSKAIADVKRFVKVPLTQNQFDACVSFAFNLGSFSEAPTLLSRINSKNFKSAAEAFGRYIYSSGEKSNGLIRRREAERKLFVS